jgi:hypothetical protein
MREGVLECGTVKFAACPRYVLQTSEQGERASPTLRAAAAAARVRQTTGSHGMAWHAARRG